MGLMVRFETAAPVPGLQDTGTNQNRVLPEFKRHKLLRYKGGTKKQAISHTIFSRLYVLPNFFLPPHSIHLRIYDLKSRGACRSRNIFRPRIFIPDLNGFRLDGSITIGGLQRSIPIYRFGLFKKFFLALVGDK